MSTDGKKPETPRKPKPSKPYGPRQLREPKEFTAEEIRRKVWGRRAGKGRRP